MSLDPATLTSVAAMLRAARLVGVCAHVDPDGDAVGSTLGIMHALDTIGVPCVPVLANGDHPPRTYAFLPGTDRYRTVVSLAQTPDVVLALDSPDPARLGDAQALLSTASAIVAVDHHPDNREYGTLNLVDHRAAATASLLWDILPALGVTADEAIATCFYTALMTDTGRFSYSNATPAAFRAAADLIEAGANANALYTQVYENRSPGLLALAARTVDRLTLANGGAVAYSWVSDADLTETAALPEETENLIDEIRVLRDIEAVALLKVHDGFVKGSLRSKGDADVGAVARSLGGGGHAAAAGFTVRGDLGAALDALLPRMPGGG
ncbi:MAG: DHH family phosphoesterase [Coriobacteriia bacterium]